MNLIKISKVESSNIDEEVLAFAPFECIDCNYDDSIPIEYYLVTPAVETENEHVELQRIVKQELGYNKFTDTYCELGQLISVSRCPQCNSENIFMDF